MARGLPTDGQGSKVYVLCAEPKEHKHFRPGARPGGLGTRSGGSVTGVTEKLFMCQMFMCLFRSLDSKFTTQWAKRDTLMSRGKNCRETIFISQLSRSYPHRGGYFERGKNALSCGRETVLAAF